ncbi:MAG: GxxExxY protein [Opitutaceae bacterium]|jgi:GxxExxY protein
MQYEELTGKILAVAFEVSNELGAGFLESIYENALMHCLLEDGFAAENQKPLEVWFRKKLVGEFYADIVVNNDVILELKAVKKLAPEHEAQLLNYLKATGKPVGILLNFGQSRLEYRRYENRFVQV